MGYIFGIKQDIQNWASALKTIVGLLLCLLLCLKMSRTLVHKQLKIGPEFYPTSAKSAFYFIDRFRRPRKTNRIQPNFIRRWTV